MAIDSTRAAANLAVELSNAYVALVIAQATADEAFDASNLTAYEVANAEARTLTTLIERIELEMSVVRSVLQEA